MQSDIFSLVSRFNKLNTEFEPAIAELLTN